MGQFIISTRLPIKGAHRVEEAPEIAPAIRIFNAQQEVFVNEMLARRTAELEAAFARQLQEHGQQQYKAGLEEGRKQVQDELAQQVNTVTEALERAGRQLTDGYAEFIKTEEKNLLELVLGVAKQVIATELRTNPEVTAVVLRQCLDMLPARQQFRLLINPGEYELANHLLNELKTRLELPEKFEITSSPSISAGGCRLEYETGCIDAELETRFDEVSRRLHE